jgi:hypothetical protein
MMRLLHRHQDEIDGRDRPDEAREDEPTARGEGTHREVEGERYPDVYREETVDTRSARWDIGSVLAVAAGAVLAVIGAVALVRTGVNETWYEPVEQVLGMDHTPLLGAVEVGVGVLLMLAGLAGARMFAALIAVLAAAGATIVAIEPDVVDPELAMEQEWAIALAVAGFVLAAVLIVSRERRHERRTERRSLRTA